MQVLNFKGNHYEIGKQVGKYYNKIGKKIPKKEIDHKLLKKIIKIYRKYYPEFLEELDGVIETAGYNKKAFYFHILCEGISRRKGCTIFGIKNKNNFLVGRNYDWVEKAKKIFKLYKHELTGYNSFIAVSDMNFFDNDNNVPNDLYFDPDDLINEKGLYIGITYAYHKDKVGYGISPCFIMKLVAEQCDNVKQAVKLIQKVPIAFPRNFFVADKNEMVIVENTTKKHRVIYPKDGKLVKTNHYLHKDLVKEDTTLKEIPCHDTYLRYYETLQFLNRDKMINYNDVKSFLLNPDHYVCTNKEMHTIWTLVLDMKKQNYDLFFGKSKEKLKI